MYWQYREVLLFDVLNIFFILFDILNIFFYNKKCLFLRFNFLFVSRPTADYSLQPISGPVTTLDSTES